MSITLSPISKKSSSEPKITNTETLAQLREAVKAGVIWKEEYNFLRSYNHILTTEARPLASSEHAKFAQLMERIKQVSLQGNAKEKQAAMNRGDFLAVELFENAEEIEKGHDRWLQDLDALASTQNPLSRCLRERLSMQDHAGIARYETAHEENNARYELRVLFQKSVQGLQSTSS